MNMNRKRIIEIIQNGKDDIDKAEDIILSNEEMVMKMASIIRHGNHQKQEPGDVADSIFKLMENPDKDVNEISMRTIKNAFMKRKCYKRALTPTQFTILSKNDNETIFYTDIYDAYSRLCGLCTRSSITGKEDFFLQHGNKMSSALFQTTRNRISKNMRDALTLMFCTDQQMCTNQPGLKSNLNGSFLNWMSHMAAHMGNSIIDPVVNIDNIVASIPGSNRSDVKANVLRELGSKLDLLTIEQLERVSEFYNLDYSFRTVRAPDRSRVGICGEKLDDDHEHQKNISLYVRFHAIAILQNKKEYEED